MKTMTSLMIEIEDLNAIERYAKENHLKSRNEAIRQAIRYFLSDKERELKQFLQAFED